MNTRQKEILDRLTRMLNAWEAIHPNELFAGMTLSQFREAVGPSFVTRQQADEARQKRNIAITERVNADKVTDELIRRVMGGVRGHEGADGPMFRAVGYKVTWERKSGLTRKGTAGISSELRAA